MPRPVAEVYGTFGKGARLGYGAPISDTVLRLTGRAPKPARDVLAANIGVRS